MNPQFAVLSRRAFGRSAVVGALGAGLVLAACALPAGRSTLRVVNDGQQFHEIAVMRLAPGKTLDDAKGFFSAPAGPPPFEPLGGMQGLDPGGSGYMTLDLQPGQYVAVCHIPDRASGKSHLSLGMIAGFTVQ
jgi:hypothetical protein